jgi:hypothetical protein
VEGVFGFLFSRFYRIIGCMNAHHFVVHVDRDPRMAGKFLFSYVISKLLL